MGRGDGCRAFIGFFSAGEVLLCLVHEGFTCARRACGVLCGMPLLLWWLRTAQCCSLFDPCCSCLRLLASCAAIRCAPAGLASRASCVSRLGGGSGAGWLLVCCLQAVQEQAVSRHDTTVASKAAACRFQGPVVVGFGGLVVCRCGQLVFTRLRALWSCGGALKRSPNSPC